jgi:hypothetical protein
MASKTRQSLGSPDIQFDDPKLARLMQHVRALTAELQRIQQLMAGGTADQVLTKTGTGDYEGTWENNAAGGALTGVANVGAGAPLFKGLSGTVAQLRTLVAGANITITMAADSLSISAAGGGGGGGSGTVTSVGINSGDLIVTGSPVTEAGTIELEIAPEAVTYVKIQNTASDAIFLGRRQGEGPGELEELSGADALAILGISASSGYPPQLAYAGIT